MTFQNFCLTGVRVWRMWAHNQWARGTLPPSQGTSPLQSSTPQILWQTTFQIHQFKLCQHAATSAILSLKISRIQQYRCAMFVSINYLPIS